MTDTTAGEAHEVAPGIHAVDAPFWGYPLSLYFLESGGRWAVVDTGIATTPVDHIVPFMERHGGLDALELVLGTHGHVDHVGGNGTLKELAPHVRFALHERDLGWAENVDRHFAQLYAFGEPEAWRPDAAVEEAIRGALGAPAAIDHILAHGDTLTFGDGRTIEVTHVGGHAPGHVAFRDAQTGTVFCGDALQGPGAMNAESGKRDFPMYRTVRDYRAGLEAVRELRPALLCTGHAGTLAGDEIGAGIDASREWTERFHALARELARRERSFTLSEIVAAVAAEWPEYAVSLQIHVTTAEHLDELVRMGELQPAIDSRVKRWTVPGA